jgi:hypothetical protein
MLVASVTLWRREAHASRGRPLSGRSREAEAAQTRQIAQPGGESVASIM